MYLYYIMTRNFFAFGCWNNYFNFNGNLSCNTLNANLDNRCLNSVTEDIKQNETLFQMGIILGDNLYPCKKDIKQNGQKKKYKIGYLTHLKRGFNKLNDINVEKHVLFGNHEYDYLVDESIINADEFDNTNTLEEMDISLERSNSILRKQCGVEKNDYKTMDCMNNKMFKNNFVFHNEFVTHKDTDNYRFIFLSYDDDMIGDLDENDVRVRLLKCELNSKLNLRGETHINNVVVCSHYPLVSLRKKSEKTKLMALSLTDYLVNVLLRTARENNVNVNYICADTHNYQESEIYEKQDPDTKIRHFVIGTGGAEFDNLDDKYLGKKDQVMEFGDLEIRIKEIQLPYGYCAFQMGLEGLEPVHENGFFVQTSNIKDRNRDYSTCFVRHLSKQMSRTSNRPLSSSKSRKTRRSTSSKRRRTTSF